MFVVDDNDDDEEEYIEILVCSNGFSSLVRNYADDDAQEKPLLKT